MQNDQEIFADNAAPFNTLKLLSAGDNCSVKRHIVDIAAQTFSNESQLSAQSTKSVTIVNHEECRISSIAMSNDTHTLFVANHKGVITQFQKEDSSLNYYPVRTFKGHTLEINSISLSNFKMHLLSQCKETLRVWDLQNGTQLVCLNGEGDYIYSSTFLHCCWNDQETLFASGDQLGYVVVWSPPLSIYNTSNQFIPLCKFKAEGDNSDIRCLKFQEKGLDLFASYCQSTTVRLWSINEKVLKKDKSKHQQNATLPLIQQPKRESSKLNGILQSFDVRGSMIVIGVNEEIFSLSADSLQSMADAIKFEQVHNGFIRSLVFSEDGKYVASRSTDGTVAIFDSKSGKCVKLIMNQHSGYVNSVVFQI